MKIDQFSHSVISDYLRPHDHSMPGLPVHHQLLEITQTHVHRVSDAIQPSHPLLSPSPPAPNPSQLIIREMQIKTAMKYHLTQSEWLSSKVYRE